MTRHVVAQVADIPPGERLIVDIAGRSIGVFNVDGRFYAVSNSCPHQGGPLCLGRTVGLATATRPGEITYTREGEILRCPGTAGSSIWRRAAPSSTRTAPG